MGYSTYFSGAFTIKPRHPLTNKVHKNTVREQIDALYCNDDWRKPNKLPNYPDSYCQWTTGGEPGNDVGIIHGGEEKFYNYVEWLQYIIDHILVPNDYVISGEVKYHGEEPGDAGILIIKDHPLGQRVIQITMDKLIKFVKSDACL